MRLASRFLRAILVLVAVVLLAWLPVSFFVYTYIMFTWQLGTSVSSGSVWMWHEEGFDYHLYDPERVSFEPASTNSVRSALLPLYERGQKKTVYGVTETLDLRFPLWLLAVIFLAWPMTSLLLARRRRKGRGFAVEPAADAAPPAIDPEEEALHSGGGIKSTRRSSVG